MYYKLLININMRYHYLPFYNKSSRNAVATSRIRTSPSAPAFKHCYKRKILVLKGLSHVLSINIYMVGFGIRELATSRVRSTIQLG
ncbi:hypothetical protein GE061_018767 [Apolygus lucorum]|uniref:Uncharacterized protein n=1 Tax=Apolygus lucorum TaxID=248454 RepID=A0A8S9X6J4_APOLU|nr:hypothetical protein GE061_018767 [Apolygus lucorum]